MAANTQLRSHLTECLKDLHLSTVRSCFEEEALRATAESFSYERYLLELAQKECEERRNSRIERWQRESKLPLEKNLANFQRGKLPRKVSQQIQVLLEGHFLDRQENVLAFGNPGSGKTHLLSAIGHELIYKGRRVYFCTCSLLVQELLIAKRDLKLAKYLKSLAKFEAIILDDVGYVQQNQEEMEVLFTLFSERYERGSVMITSNLPFSQWEKIFKNPMVTAAAIDRLVHHSVILELNIPSYRMEQAKEAMKEVEKNSPKINEKEVTG